LARARDAEARAEAAADAQSREDNFALARQWRDVAERYQFIESLERFLLDVDTSKAPLAQFEAKPFRKDLQRQCPKCSAVMRLSRVEPAEPDHDRRWFECEQCSYEENVIVKFK
jgi:predicted  nucleic acid-binding Zn ribbon protein